MLIGALMAPLGWLGLVMANPLVTPDLPGGLVAVNLALAAAGGTAPGLFYSWLATGRIDALLAARGLVAGLVAISAGCGFVPPWAAFAVGVLAGAIVPFFLYWVEHGLRWHDPNGALATHGVPGLIGTLWLALAADGRWGTGWNAVEQSAGLFPQGVAGLVVAPGHVSDIPGQLYAQLAGLASILVVALAIPMAAFGLAVGIRWVATHLARRSALAATRSQQS